MNSVFITEKKQIGGNNPCFIIAEIGQNHQGDIEIAKKLIKGAKKAGADCVKFQKSCLEEKFTKKCLERSYDSSNSWGMTYGEHKRHLEFSEEQYKILLKYSTDNDILFTASAMDMISFNFLLSLDVPFIKIGSGDSNNLVYIKYATSKNIPLVVSTGMIDKSTVNSIYEIISANHKQFCLMHCVSAYPTPYDDCNLMVLQDYRKCFDVPIGYSGHELGTKIVVAAVVLGAKVIEKHITLDRSMKGTDHQCSLTPVELHQLVREVRCVEVSLKIPIDMNFLAAVKMVEVKITEDIKIGGNNPCFIIAEVGQNHQGDIEVAKKLIRAAKESGASCVKFQKTCLSEKFTTKYLEKPYDSANSWGKTYGEHKKHLEFSETQYRELFRYAQEIGILFSASAMDMVSFDFLVNIKVPFIKISSGDSNNSLFLKYAASKKVPLIISTGMVDKTAVKTIYDIISAQHKQFCLLHCISAYPVPFEDCNLTVLQDYMKSFDVPVGYSGQEIGTAVALGAVALGAKVLEKHITLDKNLKGTDHVCSLNPSEFQQLVRDVRVIEAALGTPIKKVVTSEIPCIDKLQKSLVMGSTKNKGEILYPGDVKIKVAEPKGLNALRFEEVIYKTLVYDKKEDEPLNEGDFC